MKLLCKIGLHRWDGCQCKVCDEKRDKEHDWSKNCESCAKCDKSRENIHDWDKCFCLKCKAERHKWSKGSCNICGCREQVSVFLDPIQGAKDGRGLGLQVNGVYYSYNSREAQNALIQLVQQMKRNERGLDEPLYLLAVGRKVEITHQDAVEILEAFAPLTAMFGS